MKSFLIKLFVFLSPWVVIYALIFYQLNEAGEFMSGGAVVEAVTAGERPVLIGRAYVPFGFDIERVIFDKLRPAVTTLGNSRVLEIRGQFFNEDVSFYNLALTSNIFAYHDFLDSIPAGAEPKIILLGLEQSFFHPKATSELGQVFAEDGTRKIDYLSVFSKSFRDLVNGKFTERVNDYGCYQLVGLDAKFNKNGFRADGSRQYGLIVSNPGDSTHEDFGFRDSLERIDKGINIFIHGRDIDYNKVAELKKFLITARSRGIHVIGFMPPYAPSVYQKMRSLGDAYGYIPKLDKEFSRIFNDIGYSYFNFSDASKLGGSDREFIDGIHGSEKVYLRSFIFMAKRDPELARLTDIGRLQADLRNASNNLEVYDCEHIVTSRLSSD